ncbi:probable cytochrome P450 28d1 isoform X2 [Leptopilina heterotoma]|uniref:probable cytochrome P450 28d1 isoform X2 n=1 Tax=Leptopilina heterotoma TaxID=63436 RepID=UPI001CA84B2F|nr:probable cytochrome P450 28d1 isoform X2 [Leptopilina heterotoma]
MELSNIIASIIFVVFLTHFYLIWQCTYFRRRGIPTAKGFIPFLGHMLPVITVQKSIASLCEIFHNENKEHSMCGYYQFFTPILLIRDPDIVKSVLQTNFTSFGQNPFQLTAQKEDQLLNFNPFFVKGEKWKKARAPLTKSFSANKMKLMLPLFQNVAKKMNDYLHEQCTRENGPYEFDLKALCNKFTGEISSNGMGIEVHNFQDEINQPKFGEFTYNQLVEKLFQLPSITTEILHRMIFFEKLINIFVKFPKQLLRREKGRI